MWLVGMRALAVEVGGEARIYEHALDGLDVVTSAVAESGVALSSHKAPCWALGHFYLKTKKGGLGTWTSLKASHPT